MIIYYARSVPCTSYVACSYYAQQVELLCAPLSYELEMFGLEMSIVGSELRRSQLVFVADERERRRT